MAQDIGSARYTYGQEPLSEEQNGGGGGGEDLRWFGISDKPVGPSYDDLHQDRQVSSQEFADYNVVPGMTRAGYVRKFNPRSRQWEWSNTDFLDIKKDALPASLDVSNAEAYIKMQIRNMPNLGLGALNIQKAMDMVEELKAKDAPFALYSFWEKQYKEGETGLQEEDETTGKGREYMFYAWGKKVDWQLTEGGIDEYRQLDARKFIRLGLLIDADDRLEENKQQGYNLELDLRLLRQDGVILSYKTLKIGQEQYVEAKSAETTEEVETETEAESGTKRLRLGQVKPEPSESKSSGEAAVWVDETIPMDELLWHNVEDPEVIANYATILLKEAQKKREFPQGYIKVTIVNTKSPAKVVYPRSDYKNISPSAWQDFVVNKIKGEQESVKAHLGRVDALAKRVNELMRTKTKPRTSTEVESLNTTYMAIPGERKLVQTRTKSDPKRPPFVILSDVSKSSQGVSSKETKNQAKTSEQIEQARQKDLISDGSGKGAIFPSWMPEYISSERKGIESHTLVPSHHYLRRAARIDASANEITTYPVILRLEFFLLTPDKQPEEKWREWVKRAINPAKVDNVLIELLPVAHDELVQLANNVLHNVSETAGNFKSPTAIANSDNKIEGVRTNAHIPAMMMFRDKFFVGPIGPKTVPVFGAGNKKVGTKPDILSKINPDTHYEEWARKMSSDDDAPFVYKFSDAVIDPLEMNRIRIINEDDDVQWSDVYAATEAWTRFVATDELRRLVKGESLSAAEKKLALRLQEAEKEGIPASQLQELKHAIAIRNILGLDAHEIKEREAQMLDEVFGSPEANFDSSLDAPGVTLLAAMDPVPPTLETLKHRIEEGRKRGHVKQQQQRNSGGSSSTRVKVEPGTGQGKEIKVKPEPGLEIKEKRGGEKEKEEEDSDVQMTGPPSLEDPNALFSNFKVEPKNSASLLGAAALDSSSRQHQQRGRQWQQHLPFFTNSDGNVYKFDGFKVYEWYPKSDPGGDWREMYNAPEVGSAVSDLLKDLAKKMGIASKNAHTLRRFLMYYMIRKKDRAVWSIANVIRQHRALFGGVEDEKKKTAKETKDGEANSARYKYIEEYLENDYEYSWLPLSKISNKQIAQLANDTTLSKGVRTTRLRKMWRESGAEFKAEQARWGIPNTPEYSVSRDSLLWVGAVLADNDKFKTLIKAILAKAKLPTDKDTEYIHIQGQEDSAWESLLKKEYPTAKVREKDLTKKQKALVAAVKKQTDDAKEAEILADEEAKNFTPKQQKEAKAARVKAAKELKAKQLEAEKPKTEARIANLKRDDVKYSIWQTQADIRVVRGQIMHGMLSLMLQKIQIRKELGLDDYPKWREAADLYPPPSAKEAKIAREEKKRAAQQIELEEKDLSDQERKERKTQRTVQARKEKEEKELKVNNELAHINSFAGELEEIVKIRNQVANQLQAAADAKTVSTSTSASIDKLDTSIQKYEKQLELFAKLFNPRYGTSEDEPGGILDILVEDESDIEACEEQIYNFQSELNERSGRKDDKPFGHIDASKDVAITKWDNFNSNDLKYPYWDNTQGRYRSANLDELDSEWSLEQIGFKSADWSDKAIACERQLIHLGVRLPPKPKFTRAQIKANKDPAVLAANLMRLYGGNGSGGEPEEGEQLFGSLEGYYKTTAALTTESTGGTKETWIKNIIGRLDKNLDEVRAEIDETTDAEADTVMQVAQQRDAELNTMAIEAQEATRTRNSAIRNAVKELLFEAYETERYARKVTIRLIDEQNKEVNLNAYNKKKERLTNFVNAQYNEFKYVSGALAEERKHVLDDTRAEAQNARDQASRTGATRQQAAQVYKQSLLDQRRTRHLETLANMLDTTSDEYLEALANWVPRGWIFWGIETDLHASRIDVGPQVICACAFRKLSDDEANTIVKLMKDYQVEKSKPKSKRGTRETIQGKDEEEEDVDVDTEKDASETKSVAGSKRTSKGLVKTVPSVPKESEKEAKKGRLAVAHPRNKEMILLDNLIVKRESRNQHLGAYMLQGMALSEYIGRVTEQKGESKEDKGKENKSSISEILLYYKTPSKKSGTLDRRNVSDYNTAPEKLMRKLNKKLVRENDVSDPDSLWSAYTNIVGMDTDRWYIWQIILAREQHVFDAEPESEVLGSGAAADRADSRAEGKAADKLAKDIQKKYKAFVAAEAEAAAKKKAKSASGAVVSASAPGLGLGGGGERERDVSESKTASFGKDEKKEKPQSMDTSEDHPDEDEEYKPSKRALEEQDDDDEATESEQEDDDEEEEEEEEDEEQDSDQEAED